MSSIVATAFPALGYVRLDLDFTDFPSPWVNISRVNEVTGEVTPVRTRGTTGTATTFGTTYYQGMQAGYKITVFDTEVPRDVPVHYVATTGIFQINVRSDFTDNVLAPWFAQNGATVAAGYLQSPTLSSPALQIIPDGATANPQARSEWVYAPAGAQLSFTSQVYASAAVVFSLVAYAYTNAGVFVSSATVASVTGSSSGVTVATMTGTYTVPATASLVRMAVQVGGTPSAASSWYFVGPRINSITSSATSAPVTLPSAGMFWLRDPARPANDVRVDLCFDSSCLPTEGVFFAGMDASTLSARSALFDVSNQRSPVSVARRRATRSSTLTLVARTFADRERLALLLSEGTVLLWQAPPEFGIPDTYLAIGDVQVAHLLPDMTEQMRMFVVPFQSVQAPGGGAGGVAGARWQDACGTSWATAQAAGWTWQQLSQGVAAT